MVTLYSVTFFYRDFVRNSVVVLASERNQKAAVARARALLSTVTKDRMGLDAAHRICNTPDDVLELA